MSLEVGKEMITTIVISALAGGLLTGGVMYGIDKRNSKNNESTVEIIDAISQIRSEVAQAQLVTTENLTDTSLLKEPCSTEYIEQQGDLLCREMFCRLQTRGLDAAASQGECEQISNVRNSLIILEACGEKDAGAYQACTQIFNTRK
jgi:hypothetical protein